MPAWMRVLVFVAAVATEPGLVAGGRSVISPESAVGQPAYFHRTSNKDAGAFLKSATMRIHHATFVPGHLTEVPKGMHLGTVWGNKRAQMGAMLEAIEAHKFQAGVEATHGSGYVEGTEQHFQGRSFSMQHMRPEHAKHLRGQQLGHLGTRAAVVRQGDAFPDATQIGGVTGQGVALGSSKKLKLRRALLSSHVTAFKKEWLAKKAGKALGSLSRFAKTEKMEIKRSSLGSGAGGKANGNVLKKLTKKSNNALPAEAKAIKNEKHNRNLMRRFRALANSIPHEATGEMR